MTPPTPEHLKLIQLATAVRAAQKEYFRNRRSPGWKGYLEKSMRLERELDEYLKKANHADNLQQQLF